MFTEIARMPIIMPSDTKATAGFKGTSLDREHMTHIQRTSGELENAVKAKHRYYRELVKPLSKNQTTLRNLAGDLVAGSGKEADVFSEGEAQFGDNTIVCCPGAGGADSVKFAHESPCRFANEDGRRFRIPYLLCATVAEGQFEWSV